MKKHEQLNLFSENIYSALLVAHDSPRKAFYHIWIECTLGDIKIIKESGIKNRVLDRRTWPAESVEAAMKGVQKRIESKTNPNRNSPRKYQMMESSESAG